jgi:hypothetical protein
MKLLTLFCLLVVAIAPCYSAYDLDLISDISYVHDLDRGFPIIGKKMDDVAIEKGKATFLFLGASGDLNTNRQAKRLISLYKKYREANIKFIVIDVDRPINNQAKSMINTYYQGYIPYQAVFDKNSKLTWSYSGEVDNHVLGNQINKVLE